MNSANNRDRDQSTGGDDLSRSTSKRLIARAFSQQFVFRLLGIVANIFTMTMTTRYLGPTSYGALTTAVVFVGLWASLTELGIGAVIVRKVMSNAGSLERLVRINAGMSLVYSLPLFAVAAITGWTLYRAEEDVVDMILIISASLVLMTISSCFQPVFAATLRFGAVAVSDFLSRLATLLLTFVLVEHGAGLKWFALVQLIPPTVVLLIQVFAATRIIDCRPIFSLGESWMLFRESLPQTAMLVIGVLYWRIDGVILSLLSTQDEVGIYGLVYTLAFTISVFPTFFATSTLSAMTHLHAVDEVRFANFIARSVELMVFIGAPIAVVGTIFASQIIDVIGSEEFVARGGPTLALLLIAASASFVTDIFTQALFAAHDQIFLMRLNIVNLLINVVLNILLASRFGAVGAGIAMLATTCIGTVIANWRLRRLSVYRPPWAFATRLLMPLTACATVALLPTTISIFILVPVAALVYIATNLFLGPATLATMRSLAADSKHAGDAPTDQ